MSRQQKLWMPHHGERCEVRDDPGTMVTIEDRYYGRADDVENKDWIIRCDGGRRAIPPYTTAGIRKEFQPLSPRVMIHPSAVDLATRMESEWLPDVVVWRTLDGEFTCEQVVRAIRMKTERGNEFLRMYNQVCFDFVRRMAKRKVYELETNEAMEEWASTVTAAVDSELTSMRGIGDVWIGESWKDEGDEKEAERDYRDRLFHLRNTIAEALRGLVPQSPKKRLSPSERLQEFLYLMMRDHVPTSRCAEVVQEIEKCADKEPVYTAKGLAEYAKELAERILAR